MPKPQLTKTDGWPNPRDLSHNELAWLAIRVQGILWGDPDNPDDAPNPDKEWDAGTIEEVADEMDRMGLKP